MTGTIINSYQGNGLALIHAFQGPVSVTSAGTLVGAGSGLTGTAAHHWKIINNGVVRGDTGDGINLGGGGIILNGLAGSGGVIVGQDYGIAVGDFARIVNTDLVTGQIGAVSAGNGLTLVNNGTLDNILTPAAPGVTPRYDVVAVYGSIANSGVINAFGTGIYLVSGGTVTNTGFILADHSISTGVGIRSGGTLIFNNGAGGIVESANYGVTTADGSVNNHGTINGGAGGVLARPASRWPIPAPSAPPNTASAPSAGPPT